MDDGDDATRGDPETGPADASRSARPHAPADALWLRRREFLAALGATVAASVVPGAAGCGDASAARFLTPDERATVAALADRVLPPDGDPGAAALGTADYVDRLLAAFDGPGVPRIYAGGPFSGRNPYPDNDRGAASDELPPNRFTRFVPLSRVQELRWRAELFGTAAVSGADVNDALLGPRRGLRDIYREGLARVDEIAIAEAGDRFASLDAAEQDRVFAVLDRSFAPEPRRGATFIDIVIGHTLEACFAALEYGGNRDSRGFAMIGLEGDVQPLGFSIFSRAADGYVERPEHPMSTPNPDEVAADGSLRPRPLSPDGERVQQNILTFANLVAPE
jgi:hypothetical protein